MAVSSLLSINANALSQGRADMEKVIIPCSSVGEISDGYHTFNELYEHRHSLMCALMVSHPTRSWKSKLHDDGTMFDDFFIVGMKLPGGDITYHLPERYWEYLDSIETLEKAPPWDGHTSGDVLTRLAQFILHVGEGL